MKSKFKTYLTSGSLAALTITAVHLTIVSYVDRKQTKIRRKEEDTMLSSSKEGIQWSVLKTKFLNFMNKDLLSNKKKAINNFSYYLY